MKLFSIMVLYKGATKVTILKSASDLSSFGYFQRSSVQEFMNFTSKIVVERTQQKLRSSVKEKDYIFHVMCRESNLAGVIISDSDYPPRVSFTLLNKVLEEFSNAVSPSTWPTLSENSAGYQGLEPYLVKYQNPSESDPMMRIQKDLDETKFIMHDTIESMLNRGEKLDDLVAKSDDLSAQSKTFYKTARKTNSCCVLQ
ncbi:synaptobrevin homolog YKT6 [Strongylocentrotus purpuratus]|uniref:Synaptobrevin homolog YKT6 n=1 Tax=Strongylocentrotus purpuratus TaxID=7668 RepID=A0A7M7NTH4_STRPU|nr:synaptobrevin homolog YKT6-like [Strongylocentrotus purpuratus]XP_030841498.1 synaptobrevin homolog YKT6 [Strongylocentrotus purpuratus]XP_030841500.1 synaptobrevin homolog YKT6 [Strongylocentrotus purpuratus]|eukprot:XP_011665832.1 PREDICTED: synaptobrevin homolog YKT6 [Strongylocentrotus purpuratus]